MRSIESLARSKRTLLAASVVALAVMTSAWTTYRVDAEGASPFESQTLHGQCGPTTLRGTYIFSATGFTIVGGVAQPKTIIEVLVFDGDGNVDVTGGTLSINGAVTQGLAGVGVYTLDDECQGTLSFLPGPSFDIFVEPKEDRVRMIQTNPNNVFQGTVTRFSR